MTAPVTAKLIVHVSVAAAVMSLQSLQAQSSTQTVPPSLRGVAARGNAYYRKGE